MFSASLSLVLQEGSYEEKGKNKKKQFDASSIMLEVPVLHVPNPTRPNLTLLVP